MRKLAISLVILAMMLTSCIGYSEPAEVPAPETPVPETQPPPDTTEVVLPGEPPADRTWVSPGKVNIGNFYPGARAEYPVTIHNGNDTVATFSVIYRHPDHVATGYAKPPPEAQDWVIIADSTPILMPKETRDVLVVLAMPEEVKIESNKWEFWISVMDMSQTGTVRTELCIRWLVDMQA